MRMHFNLLFWVPHHPIPSPSPRPHRNRVVQRAALSDAGPPPPRASATHTLLKVTLSHIPFFVPLHRPLPSPRALDYNAISSIQAGAFDGLLSLSASLEEL